MAGESTREEDEGTPTHSDEPAKRVDLGISVEVVLSRKSRRISEEDEPAV